MGRLQGKIALITGAGADPGLGEASAVRFAEEGANVIVTDVDEGSAVAVGAKIVAAGGAALALRHDVTHERDWAAVFAEIARVHGRIDVLVNNVGIAIPKAFVETTENEWRRQQDINVTSMFFGCQHAIRAMRAQGSGGSIINISSIAGHVGMSTMAAYGASKGAVRLLTKGIALEVACDNIRVNSVHPGTMRTKHHIESVPNNPEIAKAMLAQIPMGRFGEPEDIANMNLFLASDEAKYITGAEFVVDGGYIAG